MNYPSAKLGRTHAEVPVLSGGMVRGGEAKDAAPTPTLVRQTRTLAQQVTRVTDLATAALEMAVRFGGPWPTPQPETTPEYDDSCATGELAAQLHRLQIANDRLGAALDRLGELV